jgi:uncharacterized membrane protein YphA (DoxX/SURF4 family)
MTILTVIVRLLLGLMFVVFGLNAFLQFMPVPPLPDTPSGRFLGALISSGYIYAIAVCQVLGGLLLMVGRFVPLGLLLLGPVIVNIVLFHIFLDRAGVGIAAAVALLAAFLVWRYRESFAPVLRP